jgi:hypothetical protein
MLVYGRECVNLLNFLYFIFFFFSCRTRKAVWIHFKNSGRGAGECLQIMSPNLLTRNDINPLKLNGYDMYHLL